MKPFFLSSDGEVFETRADCTRHERAMGKTVPIPVILLREAIRQCSPYMIVKKERDYLKDKLEQCLPVKERPEPKIKKGAQ